MNCKLLGNCKNINYVKSASEYVYCKTFNNKFNLDFKAPHKDTCKKMWTLKKKTYTNEDYKYRQLWIKM